MLDRLRLHIRWPTATKATATSVREVPVMAAPLAALVIQRSCKPRPPVRIDVKIIVRRRATGRLRVDVGRVIGASRCSGCRPRIAPTLAREL